MMGMSNTKNGNFKFFTEAGGISEAANFQNFSFKFLFFIDFSGCRINSGNLS